MQEKNLCFFEMRSGGALCVKHRIWGMLYMVVGIMD